tara:strand:+ start:3280 stop:3417 length:138 start_codon:yes stop_codon:yes gene_type:complete
MHWTLVLFRGCFGGIFGIACRKIDQQETQQSGVENFFHLLNNLGF